MFISSPILGLAGNITSAQSVAPVLTSATDTTIDDTTAALSVVTDVNVGIMYFVVTQSSTTPTAAQIIAGNDHSGSAADDSGSATVTTVGTQNFNATGLSASTAYYAHFVHYDDVNELTSTPVSANGFTTDSAADSTAPTLSSPTDAAGATSSTGDIGVDTDEANGTLYWVVTTASNTPSAGQVKLGQDHTGAAATKAGSKVIGATGTHSFQVTGLTGNTTYYAHFMHEDATANQSSVSDGNGFTTIPALPATEVLTSSQTWTVPAAADNYNLQVEVKAAGGGGSGGAGGTGFELGEGETEGDEPGGGTNGGASRFDLSDDAGSGLSDMTASGGQNGGAGAAHGTGSGGTTNDSNGSGGGAGGDGGDGVTPGESGQDGGKGGRALRTIAAGTLTPSAGIGVTVGGGGSGGAGGEGGQGNLQDGEDGEAGTAGQHGRVTLTWSAP